MTKGSSSPLQGVKPYSSQDQYINDLDAAMNNGYGLDLDDQEIRDIASGLDAVLQGFFE